MLKTFAIDESINGVAFADISGIIFYVNKSFLKLWNVSDADDLIGKSAFGLFKSPMEAQETAQRVLANGAWDGEITAIRNDQSEVILKFSAKLLTENNTPVAMMASFVDITELKKSETTIKESEHLLKLVLETLPVGVFLANKHGKLFYTNKAGREIWGGVPEFDSFDEYVKIKGRSYETGQLLSIEDLGMYKALLEGKTLLNQELEVEIGDGSSKVLSCSSVPVRNEANDVVSGIVVAQDITQSKLDLKIIEKANKELQEIIDALDQSSLVSITDLKGTILKVNKRFCQVALYEEHELLGKNHSIISSGHHDGEFWKDFWRVIGQGEIWRGEIKNKAKDGSYYWVDTVINPIRNERGKVTHFLSIRQDITRRKEYESLLETRNVELKETIDALDQSSLVSITDLRGTILKVNKRFCQVARYEENELLGKNHSIINSGYHDKEFWIDFWRTINHGGVWRGEIRNRAKDGSYYWVDTVINPIRNEYGRVTHFLSIRQDITNRKEYERLLESRNVELKEIIDALDQSSLVSITDLKGTIIKVNKRFCQVAQYEEYDLLGKNHSIINSGHHDKEFWSDFWKTISRGEVWRGEIKNRAKDGTYYWVDTVINPIRNEYGRVTHFLSIRQDITNRKEYESLLETRNVELKEIIDALDHSSLVSITDLKGTILKVNKRFCEVARYEEHELLGKNHNIISSSGYHDKKFWSDFWQTIGRGEIWRGEIKNRAKDGTEYWVDTVINPIRNENGRVTQYLSIRQDITDRKNYEDLLLKSNLRLAQIEQFVDLTTDSILVTDEQGVVVYINKVASERLGIPQEECTDFNVLDYEVLFKERDNWKGFVDGLKKIDSINGERTYFNKKTGEVFPVDVTARHVVIQDKGYTIAVARDITERKKGEMALRESKERLSEAQRIAKLGYWEQNLVTNTIWWSDIQSQIFGLNSKQVPKTNDEFIKLIHHEDRKKFIKILAGNTADSIENYRIIRPDGTVRVVHAVAQITYNERGVPVKLSGVNQDITERIEVENALRESEQTLRKAQGIAKIGSWKLDVLHDVLEWSDETYRIFNISPEKKSLKAEDFFIHVHPEDKDYVNNAWVAALNGARYDIVHRIIVDNQIKWVSQQTELTYNESPRLIQAFGTIQDITDQMILRDNNLIFNQSQSLAGIGSWRWSKRTGDLFWSDSVYQLFGINKETTKATNEIYLNAIYHEDRQHVSAMSAETLKELEPYEVEYRIETTPGKFRWIQEKGNVLVDQQGEEVEMYGIVRDITTEKISTEEIIKARKQAEEASTIKDEFLSVMSHEIRTPLNSVIGLSNLLLKRTPREDQLEIMKTLKGSADNLLHLINDILDYNKIRAGKLELEALPFSLNKFLQHLHASFSLSAQDKGLEFIIKQDPRIPDALVGDVTRMNQIFNNLLNNAIKFTQQGHIKLEVAQKRVSKKSCTIIFQVEDTGVGIAPDKLSSVFIPFQQSERSISRIYGGTGLGLSIVKTLTEIMDGTITLKSEMGVGSIFKLELEFGLSIGQEKEVPPVSHVLPAQATSKSKKLEVLYVEDVESNRFLIKNMLSDYHINCQTVSSGLAALRLTKTKKFDVILMDIQMPKMDGYQTTEKIRKQPGGMNAKTGIIAFTAEPYSEALKARIVHHNIQDVITKPFDPDQLMAKINALTMPKAELFTFAFYERACNHDTKKMQSIKKTVIKDVSRFATQLARHDKSGNLKGIRAEIHKMRPIVKNLECKPLFEIMDQYQWPENEYTREAATTTREILKLTNRLLKGLDKLKYS